jgi:hypothetical protein
MDDGEECNYMGTGAETLKDREKCEDNIKTYNMKM